MKPNNVILETRTVQFNKIQDDEIQEEKKSTLSKTNTLKLTAYNLKAFLISGGISKSDYIFLMLRLLFGNQSVEVDLIELAEFLCCAGVTALGKDKDIEITTDDIQIELAKLTKKGLLASGDTLIQLRLSDIK